MNYIKLTKTLNLSEVQDGKISKKEAYKKFITDTIFKPIDLLLKENNSDYHFLVLIILLSFFEPHGMFLGEENGSKKKFKLGFKTFLSYIKIKDEDSLAELFYKNLRCGLFHSMNMEGILIDSINCCNNLIFKLDNKYIINVDIFYNELKKYLENYISTSDENNFNKVFDELVLDKLKI